MEMVYDLLKITIPGLLVLYAVYLSVRAIMQKQLEEYRLMIRQKNQEVVTPIRLQAYERICLLLERISPSNMIPRLNNAKMTAKDLQAALVNEIRNEYNHNLSQQVYMSNEAWAYVSGAVEHLVSIINETGNELGTAASGLELAKRIFELSVQNQDDAIQQALRMIKGEIREMF